MLREDDVERPADRPLRHGEALPDRVRRLAEKRENPLLPELRHALQVRRLAEHRGVVDLEVPGVEDDARRAEDRERRAVGNRVVRLDELHVEVPERHRVPVLHDEELRRVGEPVLLKLVLNQRDREARRVHRHIQILQNVRERADVVLVAVGDDEALHLRPVVLQVRHIRDDAVDPQHVLARERDSAVHDDDAVPVLEGRHVHPDLLKAAERDDLHLRARDRADGMHSGELCAP